jgi:hypothetical protein
MVEDQDPHRSQYFFKAGFGPHWSRNSGAFEAQNGGVEGIECRQLSLGGFVEEEGRRRRRGEEIRRRG